jgi:hypothetical protein
MFDIKGSSVERGPGQCQSLVLGFLTTKKKEGKMGSGSPHKGIRRETVGGMSGAGRPTLNCPEQGRLPAVPTKGVRDEVDGRLAVRGLVLEFVTHEGATLAVATTSPETETIRACILDGLSYAGSLMESEGRWEIAFQEV